MRITSASAAGLLMLGLGACASVRTVAFVVTEPANTDHPSRPVRAAHVRVVVLDRGPVPLPLSGKTIDEILTNELATGGATGRDGRVRIELAKGVPHLVEVMAPPINAGSAADGSRGVWILGADGVTLEPQERETIGAPLMMRVDR